MPKVEVDEAELTDLQNRVEKLEKQQKSLLEALREAFDAIHDGVKFRFSIED